MFSRAIVHQGGGGRNFKHLNKEAYSAAGKTHLHAQVENQKEHVI